LEAIYLAHVAPRERSWPLKFRLASHIEYVVRIYTEEHHR